MASKSETKTAAEKAQAAVLRWTRGGMMLDARCALPGVLADAVDRLVARGALMKTIGGTHGYYVRTVSA